VSFIRKTGHTTVETLAKRLHILFATTNYSRSDDPPHPIDGVQAQLAGPLTIQHRSLVTQRDELNHPARLRNRQASAVLQVGVSRVLHMARSSSIGSRLYSGWPFGRNNVAVRAKS